VSTVTESILRRRNNAMCELGRAITDRALSRCMCKSIEAKVHPGAWANIGAHLEWVRLHWDDRRGERFRALERLTG
jgi:hypothetical protein